MEDDYYSIDSILSENQVHFSLYARARKYIHLSHRKYNVHSRSIFLTWVILMVAMSATYALNPNRICSHSPSLRTSVLNRSRPKARSNCHCGLLSSSYTRECVTASLGAPIEKQLED